MSTEAEIFYQNWPGKMQDLSRNAPEISRAFRGLHHSLMAGGELSVRDKELIAVGIALAQRCDQCIRAHVDAAMRAGASRQQIVEAAGVAVVMQGGPAYTHLPQLLDALRAIEARDATPQREAVPT